MMTFSRPDEPYWMMEAKRPLSSDNSIEALKHAGTTRKNIPSAEQKGPNAGNRFWGRSSYSRSRGIVNLAR